MPPLHIVQMNRFIASSGKEIECAFRLMMDKHINQERKDGSPYWVHSFRVWQSLRLLDISDVPMECAALLHDVVEDTDITIEQIREQFVEVAVAKLVQELTNDGSLPKCEKKELMIAKALHMDNRARIIKCFDRMDNLADGVDSFSSQGIGVDSFSSQGIWYYTKESVLLHRNLRDGIRCDEWAEKAKKAADLLERTIDNLASYCHNHLRIADFAEYYSIDVQWDSDLGKDTGVNKGQSTQQTV